MWRRIVAAICVIAMVVLVFQTNVARADTPGPGEWTNVATGGTASASSAKSGYAASKAIDADPASYWKSAKTIGWIAVRFTGVFPISEIHVTLIGNAFPSLELYLDTDNNGAYAAAERVFVTSTNSALVIKAPFASAISAGGVKLNFPVAMSGSKVPQVGDVAVFSKADTDKDGLPNDFERSTVYFSQVSATEVPVAMTDPGMASAYLQVNAMRGVPFRGMAEFVVNQTTYTQLSASIGYKTGTTWVDVPAWDPGAWLTKPTITAPSSGTWVGSSVTISATVPAPSIVTRIDFYIDAEASPKGTVSAPSGGVYSWTWSTAGYSDGSHTVRARAVDIWGGQSDTSVIVNVDRTAPVVTITSPANGASVPGPVVTVAWTIAESGTGVANVVAQLDGGSWIDVTGSSSYRFTVSLASHTVIVVAKDRAGLQGTASVTFTATRDTIPPVVSVSAPSYVCPYWPVSVTGTATDNVGLSSVTFGGATYYPNKAPSWTGTIDEDGHDAGYLATFTISATDLDGNSASASKSVMWRTQKYCALSLMGSPSSGGTTDVASADGVSSGASLSGAEVLALAVVGSPAASWGIGKWGVEAGYTAPSPNSPPRHTVRVNLTQPLSGMTAAERTARIAPLALPSEVLNIAQTWRVTITDWVAGSSTNITSFLLRFEETSSTTLADTDGDGITDYAEVYTYQTLPVAQDTDFDGITDTIEKDPWSLAVTVNGVTTTVSVRTSPTNPDSDGDGLGDGEERILGADRTVTNPANPDTDADGLWDGYTINGHSGELSYATNATRTDTDGDTFSDGLEITSRALVLTINGAAVTRYITTMPSAVDSDGDGLKDNEEWYGTSVYGVKTDPSAADTDGDGLADGEERYTKEVALSARKTIGTYVSVPLTVTVAGAIEKVTLSYGLSTIDVSKFYVTLTKGTVTYVVRSYQGSGLFNFSSVDLPSSMWSSGTFTLQIWSSVTGGILEKYRILFTIRTSPIKADTDGDGVNDKEEIQAGQDGWVTDPNMPDTDGDTWWDGYEISTAGTNPLSVDTDGDGARDNLDYDPLHNLLVKITVRKIHHGNAPWCTPDLMAAIRVNEDYTWFTPAVTATEDRYFSLACLGDISSTSVFGDSYTYYADVPDDVGGVSLKLAGWSVNWRGDDQTVSGSMTYWLNSVLGTQTFSSGGSWMTFDVSTYRLEKSRTLLITDGQATVQASNGQIRMAAPDRFFVFMLNLTTAWYPLGYGINTILVPRSVFLDSKLKADFSTSYYPLDSAPFYGDDPAKAQLSDGIAGLVGVSLTADQADSVLSRLLMNAAGSWTHTWYDITNVMFVANLPSDVVRIIPWQGVTNGPTRGPPQDFWAKFGSVISTVVNALIYVGQLIYKGFVALVTFLADLAQAIWEWGIKALGTVASAVATAVQTVANALATLASWIIDFAARTIQAAIQGLLSAVKALLDATIGNLIRLAREALAAAEITAAMLATMASYIFDLAVKFALIPVAIRVAEAIVVVVTWGAGMLVLKTIGKLTGEFVVKALSLVALSLVAEYLIAATVESFEWVSQQTVSWFKGIGVVVSTIAGIGKSALGLYKIYRTYALGRIPAIWRWIALGMEVLGLILVMAAAAFNPDGGLLFFLDILGFTLSVGGLLIYYTEGLNPLQRVLDEPTPMSVTVEKVVAYCTPPIAMAKIVVHAQTPGYG